MTHEDYMRMALQEAEQAISKGYAPFAVVVVDPKGNVVLKEHERMNELSDPTAHAELLAVQGLCRKFKTQSLKGYTFYATSEPCPTCFTACIKAQVSNVYYGAETKPTASLPIKAKELAQRSKKYPIYVEGGILGEECEKQLADWLSTLEKVKTKTS